VDEVTAAVVSGTYVDPRAGRVTVRDYAETWRRAQVHRPTTRAHVETHLRRHVYSAFGDRPIADVLPSDVQAWVAALSARLAPATVQVVHGILSSIFKAAVRDRKLVANPCEGTRLPRRHSRPVEPLTVEQFERLVDVMPARWRALVVLAAGTGLRQGEALGLTSDRVDFLRRSLSIDRQLITVQGQEPFLGPPKTRASVRTIPLPDVVRLEMARHVELFAPAEVQILDRTAPAERLSAAPLLFTADGGEPVRRTAFSAQVWRPAVAAAGLPAGTRFHDLRHFYASLLIRHSESVKTVQARLGHASAAETLDTYSHLWPDSDDRTREAVDQAFKIEPAAANSGPNSGGERQSRRSEARGGRAGL
jgi:integrase